MDFTITQIAQVTFSTIYCLVVDRNMRLKKASYLEEIADRGPEDPESFNDEVLESYADRLNTLEHLVNFQRWSCTGH